MKTKVKKCLLVVVMVFGMAVSIDTMYVEAVEGLEKTVDVKDISQEEVKGVFGNVPWKWEEETQTVFFDGGDFPETNYMRNIQTEIERKFLYTTGKKIKKIVFTKPVIANKKSSSLFCVLNDLEAIENLHLLDTKNVVDMSYMFSNTHNLKEIDSTNLNTNNVTNMSNMFCHAQSIVELDVNNWNTSKVTNMSGVFYGATNLKELNLSNWDTSKVTDMSSVFGSARSLTELDISDWDTSNVTNMYGIFSGTSNLGELDISDWDMSNVTNMSSMFHLSSIAELDVSSWNTSRVTNMYEMFSSANNLLELDTSNWDTSKVTNMNSMFSSARSLTKLDVSKWNTSNVTDMRHMYNNAKNLSSLDVSKWNTGNVTDMQYMFNSASNLIELDVGNWNTSTVTNMRHMFDSASKLKELDVSNWDTSEVTNMNGMFLLASNIKRLDVSKWNTIKVTNMCNMFDSASSLTELDLSNWKFGGRRFASEVNMFSHTDSLDTLSLGTDACLEYSNIPEKKNTDYTGKWILVDGGNSYSSSTEFMTSYDGSKPGKYVREKAMDPTKVAGISMTPKEISLSVGKSKLLYPMVVPETAVNKKVVYKSSDVTVAKVLSNGKVQAVGTGTATITATTDDGGFIATSTVTVN